MLIGEKTSIDMDLFSRDKYRTFYNGEEIYFDGETQKGKFIFALFSDGKSVALREQEFYIQSKDWKNYTYRTIFL